MKRWNFDKKHRCPECHAIWVYGPKYAGTPLEDSTKKPRWWRIYECYECGTRFAGWGREQ